MPDYRIRWREKGTLTWINTGADTGLLLPGTAVSITNITASSTTVTVTTGTTNHNFKKGQAIILSGVTATGTDAAKLNGIIEVTGTGTSGSNYNFTFTSAAAWTFTYSSGGVASPTIGVTQTISTITGTGTTATVTTATAHGFKKGEQVRITGSSVTGYNVTTEVLSVPSTTTFTFASATSTSATGGNAVSTAVFTIRTSNSSATITSGKTYEVQVAYEPLTGSATYSNTTCEATPLAENTALPAGTTDTSISGTLQTDPGGDITCGRVGFVSGGSTFAYGIKVTFAASFSSWTSCSCTVTYLGQSKTYTISRGQSTSIRYVYFPAPLKATCSVVVLKQGGGSGTFTVGPYYG